MQKTLLFLGVFLISSVGIATAQENESGSYLEEDPIKKKKLLCVCWIKDSPKWGTYTVESDIPCSDLSDRTITCDFAAPFEEGFLLGEF